MSGEGVKKDPARAVALFQQSCDAGAMSGCHQLGSREERGQGTPRT